VDVPGDLGEGLVADDSDLGREEREKKGKEATKVNNLVAPSFVPLATTSSNEI